MHSSIRNTSIERTTHSTQSIPKLARLIQQLTFLSVSSNQSVTQAEVALATNPLLQESTGPCDTTLLVEMAHQISLQSCYLQFRQATLPKFYSTNQEFTLRKYPLLDETVPMILTCTNTYLEFTEDNTPGRIAVDVTVAQAQQPCCEVCFTLVLKDEIYQVFNSTTRESDATRRSSTEPLQVSVLTEQRGFELSPMSG